MLPWLTANVIKIEEITPNTRRYWLQVAGGEPFDFKAGQFVTLDLPIHEQRNKRWRSYSIASAPEKGSDVLELLIVLAQPSTGGSEYIWNNWTVGSETTLRGPQGSFYAPYLSDSVGTGSESLFMICTGTGIAPFRSQLLHWKAQSAFPAGEMHLIFGARTQTDLLYAEEMQSLTNEYANFYYHPTLSREEWPGNQGYVHDVYKQLCAPKPPAHFMLCGWRNMVDEAKKTILEMGYGKERIHLELYG